MIVVRFDKRFAEQFLDAINNGKPIEPPFCPVAGKPAWTGNSMLALAGLMYAGVFSQGPHSFQLAGKNFATFQQETPTEHAEAVEETFRADIHSGIDFVSMLAFKVFDGEYDSDCEPAVVAMLAGTGEDKSFTPVQGFKGLRNAMDGK